MSFTEITAGNLTVDRFMSTEMQCPCKYDYIPHTLSEDRDPVDVMIITPAPLLSGCVIHCRPLGILKLIDEAGPDPKLLAVPVPKLSPFYSHVVDSRDMQPDKLAKITHFSSITRIWRRASGSVLRLGAAWQEILDAEARYNASLV